MDNVTEHVRKSQVCPLMEENLSQGRPDTGPFCSNLGTHVCPPEANDKDSVAHSGPKRERSPS